MREVLQPLTDRKGGKKMTYETPTIPRLVPEPVFCEGAAEPVLCLDGIWNVKHCHEPEKYLEADFSDWLTIPVPSSMSAHKKDGEQFTGKYIYKRLVKLPEEFADRRLLLRFEGVNGLARVYVDGCFVREHQNGFITWNQDITEYAAGKREFVLTVAVDETRDKVSTFSHNGILHSIYLYALPEYYISSLHMTTTFDEAYENAVLRVDYAVGPKRCAPDQSQDYSVKIKIFAPDGSEAVEVQKPLKAGEEAGFIEIDFENPLSWDAEHPRLYTAAVSLVKSGRPIEETKKQFGFRQIVRRENQLFVNGKEVKLRGSCRHEISPLDGRCVSRELIDRDVALFKEANCNYIRTSHYPPSEYFLDACDRAGIYVEDELALAFIARTLDYTQQDPAQTQRYLSHFTEVLARDYSHPSVLIWSLCNESFGGYNFDLLNRFAHKADPTRPTKFSYPMTMREEHEPVDIWSIHYSELDEDLSEKKDNVSVGGSFGKDMPVIHDEYAHIPCYNRTEHRRDPNVRNFWGESIRRFWDKIWNTKGALGGAIWAGIDETDIFLGGNTHLEWGIIDIWRRRKPEFYVTRKAYSPVVIPERTVSLTDQGVEIPVENRFCHTDFSECTVEWSCGDKKGARKGPEIAPFGKGRMIIGELKEASGTLRLDWFDAVGNKVDEYELEISASGSPGDEDKNPAAVSAVEASGVLTVAGDQFEIRFSMETGLIQEGICAGERILIGGPVMNTPYLTLAPWEKKGFSWKMENGTDNVVVTVSGSYGTVMDVTFTLTISGDGTIRTAYRIDKLKKPLPKQVKLRVGVDCGGLDELGVAFVTAPGMDRFTWKRIGQWSIYPEDHIARNEGTACRRSAGSEFGKQPEILWKDEMKNYILNGKYDVDYKGTADFRSMKTEIRSAELYREGQKAAFGAVSDGKDSVRIQVAEPEEYVVSDRDGRIVYQGEWYPMEDYSGSRNCTEMWSKQPGASAELVFHGTGIVWYGPVDTIYGIAKVYVDGKLTDGRINQRVDGVDFPGSAAGYDKKYGYPVYSIDGLEDGDHTFRIEVTGEKAPDAFDSYIVIDYFRILTGTEPEPLYFIVNNEYNYPHIAWGNYTKPEIMIYDGYENEVTVELKVRE